MLQDNSNISTQSNLITPERTLGDLRNHFNIKNKISKDARMCSLPFWKLNNEEQLIVHFLPDLNPENPNGFIVEKSIHHLKVGNTRTAVPCPTMFGEKKCPICELSQQYYNNDDPINGKKFWKRKSKISQVLVKQSPHHLQENGVFPGTVMSLNLSYSISKIIEDSITDGTLDTLPFAYKDSPDFIIEMDKQSPFPSYTSSKFAPQNSDLTDNEITFAKSKMIDLSTILPRKFSPEKVEALLIAAVCGTPYNGEGFSDN